MKKSSFVFGLLLFFAILAMANSIWAPGTDNRRRASNTESVETTRTSKANTKKTSTSEKYVADEKTSLPDYSDRRHVYVRDVMRDYEKYEGVGLQVYVAGLSDIRVFHDKVYCNADSEYEIDLQANVYRESMDEYYDNRYEDEGYIIGGVVTHEGDGIDEKVILDRAVIIGRLDNNDIEYRNMKSAYEETLRQDVIREESNFKANAVTVSYDDLLRYPDTWKDKPVYLTLHVNEVKIPTGFLDAAINGTSYLCVIPGTNNEIIVSDLRDVKEPTIMEGDTISFYGSPDGLGSIKVYDPDKIFNNTIDRYKVPQVNIRYM